MRSWTLADNEIYNGYRLSGIKCPNILNVALERPHYIGVVNALRVFQIEDTEIAYTKLIQEKETQLKKMEKEKDALINKWNTLYTSSQAENSTIKTKQQSLEMEKNSLTTRLSNLESEKIQSETLLRSQLQHALDSNKWVEEKSDMLIQHLQGNEVCLQAEIHELRSQLQKAEADIKTFEEKLNEPFIINEDNLFERIAEEKELDNDLIQTLFIPNVNHYRRSSSAPVLFRSVSPPEYNDIIEPPAIPTETFNQVKTAPLG